MVWMDNFLTGSPRNLEHLAGKTRFRFMEQDITQPFSIDGPVELRGEHGFARQPQGLCFTLRLLGTSGNDLRWRQSLGVPDALSLPWRVLSGMLI